MRYFSMRTGTHKTKGPPGAWVVLRREPQFEKETHFIRVAVASVMDPATQHRRARAMGTGTRTPRRNKRAPRRTQGPARPSQEAPKTAQERFRGGPFEAKSLFRWSREHSRLPRHPQDDTKEPQDELSRPQAGPNMPPRRPKRGSRTVLSELPELESNATIF